MLVIRLTRVGKKNSPAYRVVVADKRRAVKRKFIEILGNYNPALKPKQITIMQDRALFWMNLGAQPSDTVRNLMVDLGILAKDQKAKKIYAKAKVVPVTAKAATSTQEETDTSQVEVPVEVSEEASMTEDKASAETAEVNETAEIIES